MNGKTHRFGGICAGIVCADMLLGTNLNIETLVLATTITSVSAMGSLVPDIDTKTSTISKRMPITSFILRLFTKHREIMHTYIPYVAGVILLFLPFSILSLLFGGITRFISYSILAIYILLTIGFMSGVTSHFLLDMITTEGIPILYPLLKKKISIAKLTEKKTSHKFIVKASCIAIVLVVLYFNHIDQGDIIGKAFLFVQEKVLELWNMLTTSGGLTQTR